MTTSCGQVMHQWMPLLIHTLCVLSVEPSSERKRFKHLGAIQNFVASSTRTVHVIVGLFSICRRFGEIISDDELNTLMLVAVSFWVPLALATLVIYS